MSARSRRISLVFARHAWRAAVGARFGLMARSRRREAAAVELRRAFQELGPAWIKLGQLISVRPDVFPSEYVFEMERLRDAVDPLPAEEIRRVIRSDFGRDVEELFAWFEETPVASASIAQVHRARLAKEYRPVVGAALPAGTPLAVKVVRPGAESAILDDIATAMPLAERLGRIPRLRRFNIPGLLREFAASLESECDLRNEAAVADRFSFDFRSDPLVIVPRVVWARTSRRVLTMEYADGWRLSDLDEPARHGIDARGLALHGAEIFMRSVLELGRFHADLHPANVFVTPDGRICYLDFGIVGTTELSQRAAIAQVLAATVYGDAERALRYSAELGLVIPDAEQNRVRGRVAALMADTLAVPPRDVRGFAVGFLRVMNDAGAAVPVGFGLLIKALVTVEGVARAIYPDLDITEAAKPYATRLVAAQLLSPSRLAERGTDAVRAAIRELAG